MACGEACSENKGKIGPKFGTEQSKTRLQKAVTGVLAFGPNMRPRLIKSGYRGEGRGAHGVFQNTDDAGLAEVQWPPRLPR